MHFCPWHVLCFDFNDGVEVVDWPVAYKGNSIGRLMAEFTTPVLFNVHAHSRSCALKRGWAHQEQYMAGEMELVFSLSARIHVLLRRETQRITDVEWMTANADYAREILKVSRATGHAELLELCERVENVHPLLLKPKPTKPTRLAPEHSEQEGDSKYLFTLR